MTQSPLQAAQQAAQENPKLEAMLIVTSRRTDRLSDKAVKVSYFHIAGGATKPLTTRDTFSDPYFRLPRVDLDIRPQQPLGKWESAATTKHRRSCPRCGCNDLEVRRAGSAFLVNHCGELLNVSLTIYYPTHRQLVLAVQAQGGAA